MTFALIGRCSRTGQLGGAVVSANIAGAAHVCYCEAGIGAALSLHRTDPRLSRRAVILLRDKCTAEEAIAGAFASSEHREWRQLAVLDASGDTAARTGGMVRAPLSEAPASDVCAIGCGLGNVRVSGALLHSFQSNQALPLAERLMRALEAGAAAGGLDRPARSAALVVVERMSVPEIDLRIDWHEEPVGALRTVWEQFAPDSGDYQARALDPRHSRVL